MRSPTLYAHQPPSALNDFDFDPRKLLRRRSSLVVADLPPRPSMVKPELTNGEEMKTKEVDGETEEEEEEKKKKKKPTQFQEPDANSLLDAFGF